MVGTKSRAETTWAECGHRSRRSNHVWTSVGCATEPCQWEKPPLAGENGSRREQREALIDFPSLSQVLQLPLIGIAQRSSHQL